MMPTKDRRRARAAALQLITLYEAADRAGYAPETLRKMLTTSTKPPPLFKFRGRWYARSAEFDAWLIEHDGVAS